MIAKNDALGDLVRDLGPLLVYELLALGYAGAARARACSAATGKPWQRLPEARRASAV